MKQYQIFIAIAVLVLTSLACQALSGGRKSNDNSNPSPTVKTDFPMTDDAFNVTDLGDGSILYYTKLSAEQAMQFYRDAYAAKGYTERKTSTVVSDTTFSMVFDGDPSGKAVVVQSVDMGNGTRTITVRFEDV